MNDHELQAALAQLRRAILETPLFRLLERFVAWLSERLDSIGKGRR